MVAEGVVRRGPVGYVMSRFPKLTETFILYEVLALEEQGVDVRLYPLLRERQSLIQPEAAALVERATYLPFVSLGIVRSNLILLATRPRRYLGALAALARDTVGSRNYFVGGLAIFPKVAHMARLMERAGIVHVHCHFSNHPAAAGFVIHRLTGLPFSFTAHGSDLHIDRHMLCRKVAEADFAVAISEDNRRVILAECGPGADDKVEVIHCGVDTDRFAPVATAGAERAPADGRFTILAIGTLHEVKGQGFLVDACRILLDAGIDVVCRLVGDGPDEAMLRRRIERLGLGDRVVFEGRRTRGEIIELLHASDVVVTPSVPTRSGRREGIPVVLMEAMAAGVAVVASGISGIPELVAHERTGLLVPPGDPSAIAAAVRRLVEDPELRARLAAAGRERVVREFDVRTNAARLADRIFAARSPEAVATARRARARRRDAFTVALIGPDGAGKTTIARRLERELPIPVSYLYMGVNPASGNRILPTTRVVDAVRRRRRRDGENGHRPQLAPPPGVGTGSPASGTSAPRGIVRSAAGAVRAVLRVTNRLAEEWYRQSIAWAHLRRGRIVIFDRHFYSDYYATDVAAARPGLSRRVHGLVLDRLYPKPDLVVYLDAPAEILFARKGEGTLASLEQKRAEYLDLGRRLDHFAVVDASASEADVAAATRRAILAFADDSVASR